MLNLSWRVATVFGIPVRLHFTMVIVPVIALGWVDGYGAMSLLVAGAGAVLFFGSVLAHELGHSLTARRFGVQTHDIVLTPIGGMARILNMPTRPTHEILIAAAGPAVSFVLAAVSFVLLAPLAAVGAPPLVVDGLALLFWVNAVLGLFNLIPALPMDGGRILRGILATRHDFLTATRKAVRVGKGLAIVGFAVGALALLGRMSGVSIGISPWNIIFISAFVYFGAGQEERFAAWREAQRRGYAQVPTGAARYWTWTWDQARGRDTADREHVGRSTDPRDGWPTSPDGSRARGRGPGVIVVQGGRAEVISRKDPER